MKQLLIFLLTFNAICNSQSVQNLDTTFGNSGIVLKNFSNEYGKVSDQVIQPDGKIIIYGRFQSWPYLGFVKRLNVEGSDDTTFGDNGLIVYNGEVTDVVVAEGKILVGEKKLHRLNLDGTPDLTFATNGVLNQPVLSLAQQDDGKIIFFQQFLSMSIDRGRVVRVLSDGELDTSFAQVGFVTVPNTSAGSNSNNIFATSTGEIILEVYFSQFMSGGPQIVRWDANGTQLHQVGYGTNPYSEVLGATELQTDGKLLLTTAYYPNPLSSAGCTAIRTRRYLPNGVTDPSFAGGMSVVPTSILYQDIPPESVVIRDILIQPDSKTLILGSYKINLVWKQFILRLTVSGYVDTTFGELGVLELTDEYPEDIDYVAFNVINNELSICGNTSNNYIYLHKRNFDGNIISSDTWPFFTEASVPASETVRAVNVTSDGKIVTCAMAEDVTYISRFHSDGTQDVGFGNNGVVELELQTSWDYSSFKGLLMQQNDDILFVHSEKIFLLSSDGTSIAEIPIPAIQNFNTTSIAVALPNDKILLALESSGGYSVTSLNTDLTLDSNYGEAGTYTSQPGLYFGLDLVFQHPDGGIILCGKSSSGYKFRVLKLTASGIPDPNFGVEGVSGLDMSNSSSDKITGCDILPDGRLFFSFNRNSNVGIFALAANGTLDTTLNSAGSILLSELNGLTNQRSCGLKFVDNKILLGGSFKIGNDFHVYTAQIDLDGTLNDLYGTGGLEISQSFPFVDPKFLEKLPGNKFLISGNANSANQDLIMMKIDLNNNLDVGNYTKQSLLFYPNPSSGVIYLTEVVKSIMIFSLEGKLLQHNTDVNTADVSSLRTGCYLISIQTSDGKIVNQKLMRR
ncbi:MAG: T9SS type A sorting domain-containing protein [Flavobacterium sp.]|nr:T9SS type A sorting domain-containing protein [Flavobacterium sp.]